MRPGESKCGRSMWDPIQSHHISGKERAARIWGGDLSGAAHAPLREGPQSNIHSPMPCRTPTAPLQHESIHCDLPVGLNVRLNCSANSCRRGHGQPQSSVDGNEAAAAATALTPSRRRDLHKDRRGAGSVVEGRCAEDSGSDGCGATAATAAYTRMSVAVGGSAVGRGVAPQLWTAHPRGSPQKIPIWASTGVTCPDLGEIGFSRGAGLFPRGFPNPPTTCLNFSLWRDLSAWRI